MTNSEPLRLAIEAASFPCDRLRVRRFRGREAISRLFDYEVEVLCLDRDGPLGEEIVGSDVTIVLERDVAAGASWGGVRRLHGVVVSVEDELSRHEGYRVLVLRIAPAAHVLAMVETLDVHVDVTVPALLRAKCEAVGLEGALELRLLGEYPAREFVVQYQETDLAFVSRLAEHVGVSFFFDHGDDRARLVFTDHATGFGRVEGDVAAYRDRGESLDVFALSARRSLVEGFHVVRDYNYRTPLVDLTGEHALEGACVVGGRIEYGAHHKTPEEAAVLARVRAEEHLAGELVYTGKSRLPALGAGLRVRLEGHPELGPIDLLVIEVEHSARVTAAGFDEGGASYENTFRAIPADRTFRPARVTPKPRIPGLVTAIVDANGGPDGRYAILDGEGRYYVRFLFDTSPGGRRAPSHPVRMLQNHAGEGYGTHFPLKPGAEVAIGFVGGDPDRPVIVGAVPNPTKPSPVTGANPGVHRIRTSSGVTIDLVE